MPGATAWMLVCGVRDRTDVARDRPTGTAYCLLAGVIGGLCRPFEQSHDWEYSPLTGIMTRGRALHFGGGGVTVRAMADKRPDLTQELLIAPGGVVSLSESRAAKTFGWTKEKARERTDRNLKQLEELQYHLYADSSKSLLIVLQGIDAAGKDGVIRKVFTAFNPQGTHVTSFKAPVGRETSHDYLWRVHAVCPPRGSIGIFNRSHYEDLIVPMLNDQLKGARLNARIDQVNDFERLLTSEGTTVIKFLLHISRDEQWERLKARLDDPTRNWKFRMGDLAERKRWDKYIATFSKVVKSTSSTDAPWYVIPADSKWFRDLAVSEIVRFALSKMNLKWPKPSAELAAARKELNRLR